MLTNKVDEIMTRDIVSAAASTPALEVMEMMAAKNVGRVIITKGQSPVGIFTETDVLTRVMKRKSGVKDSHIQAVMTAPVFAVPQDTHIVEALGRMYRGGFRHLLVSGRQGAIIGMVSMRRILKLVVEIGRGLGESRTIGSIMSSDFVTVDAARSVYDTIALMIKRNACCVIVLSKGKPNGIFTERDVLRRVIIKDIEKDIDTKKVRTRQMMTAHLVSMPQSALVGEVLAKMYEGGFRHVPILGNNGELVGIVSMRDVLKYAEALDIDENVRKTWKEVEQFWASEAQYTPG